MQVKGVMPQKSGLTRQTPTGRAVGSSKHGITFLEDSERLCHFILLQCNQAVEAGRSYAFCRNRKKVYRQRKKKEEMSSPMG